MAIRKQLRGGAVVEARLKKPLNPSVLGTAKQADREEKGGRVRRGGRPEGSGHPPGGGRGGKASRGA